MKVVEAFDAIMHQLWHAIEDPENFDRTVARSVYEEYKGIVPELEQVDAGERMREKSDVWLYAWGATIGSPAMAGATETDRANRWADDCVRAFAERFRPEK